MKHTLLFLITEDWYFCSHRLALARAVRDSGFSVIVCTRVHRHGKQIQNEGFQLFNLKLKRGNRNIFQEIVSLLQIISVFRRTKPTILHNVSLKPVLYGSLAGRICGVPSIVNALAGLGCIFSGRKKKAMFLLKFVLFCYKKAFSGKNTFGIFQNPEDLKLFVDAKIVSSEKAALIKGAGVNLSQFAYVPESNTNDIVVLFASRLLWSKGVGEFVKAIDYVRKEGVKCRALIAGLPDFDNPEAVSVEILEKWNRSGAAEWLGYHENMANLLSLSHIVVLPTTYGEGVPKILIEAAACGRPIVATDVPGCREIVRNGVNGLLVPRNNIRALASAIKRLIMSPELRKEMGDNARRMAETEFAENIVIAQTMHVYNMLLHNAKLDQDKNLSTRS